MKCTRVEKFLPLHVAGDLTGRRRAHAVTKHLTMCAACHHAAAEYDASHKLLRTEAASSLPAEFDGAFYEEIRTNVLAQIKQERTLAPPPSVAFSSFFNGRLAYAASLALIISAAALSFHSYLNRTAGEKTQQKIMSNANRQLPVTPTATATPEPTQATTDHDRQTLVANDKLAGEKTNGGINEVRSPAPKRRMRNQYSRSGTHTGLVLTKHAPSPAGRDSLASTVPATIHPNAEAMAAGGSASVVPTEVSRIEIQTSDPNIRIIWLSPGTDSAQPLK